MKRHIRLLALLLLAALLTGCGSKAQQPTEADASVVQTALPPEGITALTLSDDTQVLRFRRDGDIWYWQDDETFPLDQTAMPALLEAARAEKLREINAAYEEALARVTADYPPSERLSFEKQEAEASAWTADGDAPTPFMDALAAGRGMDKATLARKILEKAALFAAVTGALTGQRQRFEDETASARTLEAVDAVSPVFTLPGTEPGTEPEGGTDAGPEQGTGPDAETAAPETAGGEG